MSLIARALAVQVLLSAGPAPLAPVKAFDLQGHRGARGLVAENTLAAFERALALGVSTIETDLALTRDGVVVLTHDPRLNPDLVRDADGRWIPGPGPTVRSLTYEEVQRFDVGRVDPTTRYGAQWAGQTAVEGARMPTLDALIARATMQRPTIRFNVETKLSPLKPEETADPETFVRATLEVIARHGASTRVTIQSFDWRSLLVTRRLAPEIATACLTIETANTSNVRAVDGRPSPWLAGLDPEQFGGSIPRTVQAAGCATWSPFWRNVTPALVEEAHGLGLKVVPWTVNEPAEMARLVAMKVDGLITDYPDRAGPVLTAAGLAPR